MEIKGYPNYLIYDDGRIYSKYRKKIINGSKDKDGYLLRDLYHNQKRSAKKVHRLVALHYIPNPNNYPEVDHINRIKTDNRVENLRWANRNIQHSNKNIRKDNILGLKNIHKTPSNTYCVIIRRYYLIYKKNCKTEEDAIKQRDLMLSMWPQHFS